MPPPARRKAAKASSVAGTVATPSQRAMAPARSSAVEAMIASVLSGRIVHEETSTLSGGGVTMDAQVDASRVADKDLVGRFSAMLRAIYVVAHTEKAQRRVRSANGGIMESMGSLTPHKLDHHRGNHQAYQNIASSSASPRRLCPPSFIGATSSPAPTTPVRSGSDIVVVVFVDPRWLSAVSEFAQTSVTLDHLAQLSKVFPEYLAITWSHVSAAHIDIQFAMALGNRLDEFLRDIASAEGSSFLADDAATARPHGDEGDALRHREIRARVALQKAEVPDLAALAADLEARGGASIIRSFSDVTASRLAAASSDVDGSGATSGAAVPDRIGPITTTTNLSVVTAVSTFPAGERQRKRMRSEATAAGETVDDITNSCCSSTSVMSEGGALAAGTIAGLSDALLHHLSESKLLQVVSASSALQQEQTMREAERIHRQREVEKLLGVYDLTRGLLGSTRTSIGGARLIDDLAVQNRYGCSREEVCGIVRRLLSIPASGMTVDALGGGAASDAGAADRGATSFDDVLFVFEPSGCRANLATVIESAADAPMSA